MSKVCNEASRGCEVHLMAFFANREAVAVACDMPHRENEERECGISSGSD